MRLFLLLLLIPGLLGARLAPKPTYQPIIDAKPFGDMAATTETDTVAAAEEQKQKEEIAQKFRMCGITDMPDGSRKIAFLDETSGTAASYLLGVGEAENGFTLLSADYAREFATLQKDGLTFTLGLGRGLIDAPPETDDAAEANSEAQPEPAAPAAQTSALSANRLRRALPPKQAGTGAPAQGSFRSRLLKRRAAQAEAAASEKQALQKRVAEAEAERIKADRRIQIERIKQGLAPTQPITLTPEEDAELEAAGVFRGAGSAPQTPAEEPEAPAPETPPAP